MNIMLLEDLIAATLGVCSYIPDPVPLIQEISAITLRTLIQWYDLSPTTAGLTTWSYDLDGNITNAQIYLGPNGMTPSLLCLEFRHAVEGNYHVP